MREALTMRGQFGRVGRAIRLIHISHAKSLDVAQLAKEAGMSVPSFHSHFKAITKTSPMQYLKSTRLHQARLLMVRQDLTAEAASYAVGYTSPSQFSREFKRLFGLTPAVEAHRMRESFTVPPVVPNGVSYISSH
jgi:AraC-like DNA-binding protein